MLFACLCLCLGFVRFVNVGADACVVGSLCSVLSLFVCSVSLCACVRVESSVCLFRSGYTLSL